MNLRTYLMSHLVYPGHTSPSLFDFLLGKIPRVVIRIEKLKFGGRVESHLLKQFNPKQDH
ncbi:MAG: hypothetical protein CM1200mP28_07270 [Deltaproteobacteria bacterium]|nr:MAG: hypothetical protein CM1200mP28_07270 [Deltaproteobacteria bacterium]